MKKKKELNFMNEVLEERENIIKEPYDYKRFMVDRDEAHKCFGGIIKLHHFDTSWEGEKTKKEYASRWAMYIKNAHDFDILCSKKQIIKIR